jgi:cytochrome c551/c552
MSQSQVKTIGPAYKQIAERYPLDDETVATLSNKVIKVVQVLGNPVMSAHPNFH